MDIGPTGVVVLLDELGLFLSAKDRAGLNADASFLQWLAQRTATSRCWVICATQRGLEEVGDIDRRTLRQLRDRFRSGFTLDLAEFEWVGRKVRFRCALPPRIAQMHACTICCIVGETLDSIWFCCYNNARRVL